MTTATEALVTILSATVGARLLHVEYGLVEADENQELGSVAMQLESEAILRFSDRRQIYFTWSAWPGAKQDWVLRGTSTSLSQEPTKYLKASSFEPWSSLAGRPLIGAQVMGWNGEPSVVRLCFDQGAALVGVGSDGWFGSSDSLLIRPDQAPFLDFPVPIETMWSSNHVA